MSWMQSWNRESTGGKNWSNLNDISTIVNNNGSLVVTNIMVISTIEKCEVYREANISATSKLP